MNFTVFMHNKGEGGDVMSLFIKHLLVEADDGYDLILYIDPLLTEFADELTHSDDKKKDASLRESVSGYIREKIPGVKVNKVKIMLGTMLLATLFMAGPMAESAKAATGTGTVAAQQAGEQVRVVINGQARQFSQPAVNRGGTTYVPVRELAEALGGTVWWNAGSRTVGINKGDTKIAFVIGSGSARVNGKSVSMQPSYLLGGTTMAPLRFIAEAMGEQVGWNETTKTVTVGKQAASVYTVKPGDSLWKIANAYGLTAGQLQTMNNLKGTTIYPGQTLIVSPGGGGTAPSNPTAPAQNTVTYETYTVKSGDNIWDLSIRFGIPQHELLKVNNLTASSTLAIGQKLTIPVHRIAVKPTVSERHGEHLDWWTEAQYLFPINKVATVVDFQTGRSFQVKRTIGANHADCEPLTTKDSKIIKEIWGGSYSWKERAVLVVVDGRKIAASMSSMPHDISYIKNNGFDGHFDIHFKNSTRHSDGKISDAHQRQIAIAAGVAAG
jgi:LysM repeat protein